MIHSKEALSPTGSFQRGFGHHGRRIWRARLLPLRLLKGKIYGNEPCTMEDLKENIQREIAAIPPRYACRYVQEHGAPVWNAKCARLNK